MTIIDRPNFQMCTVKQDESLRCHTSHNRKNEECLSKDQNVLNSNAFMTLKYI